MSCAGRRPWKQSWCLIVLLGGTALVGCGDLFDIPTPDIRLDIDLDSFDVPPDVPIDPTAGKALGEACDSGAVVPECRFGLACEGGVCAATGQSQRNQPCILTAECGPELHCSVTGTCQPAGTGAAGTSCSTAGDCRQGLVCRSFGFAGACVAAGPGDLGAICDGVEDCLAGLACGADGTCQAGSPVFGLTLWGGVTCEGEDLTGPPRVYFEVPRPGVPRPEDGDFFRLPFPNDIRVQGGKVDLSGFPTPGPGLVGFDPVARVIDAARKVQTGFSTEPVVTFRLSRNFDLETIRAAQGPAGAPTLYFVDIDPDSPQYGWTPAYSYFVTDGGTRYICPRYVQVRPTWNEPLRAGTTYAVILATGLATHDGTAFGPDADMSALLGAAPPADAGLAAAWAAYAPLRAYLADPDKAILTWDRVLAAAVFTTQRVSDVLPAIRAAISDSPMPQPVALTECKPGVTSPCDDGLAGDAHVRGCFGEDGRVHELHFKLPLPRVQAGTRPYLAPEDGGDLVLDAAGKPALQGTEPVCVSLTIPKGQAMPEAGWPVAIYGHGTGGTFRSAVADAGLPLSAITLDDGATVGVAVAGWDGPMHGSRAGSTLSPEALFYNIANPVAARGNLYQGAADVFALVRALKALTIPAASSPTGAAIRFDATKMLYIGHSQGATTGPLATPYEPDLRAVIWSGAGAGLVLSLLAKKEPIDAPLAAAVALQELDRGVPVPLDDRHPALALVQGLFDPVDPLNHGSFQTVARDPAHPIQHVLQTFGVGDSYTPPATIEALARVMRVQLVRPVFQELGPAFTPIDAPVRDNLEVPGGRATAVLLQAQPSGYDGHFVLFRDATLQRRYQQWVGTFVRDGAPTVVP